MAGVLAMLSAAASAEPCVGLEQTQVNAKFKADSSLASCSSLKTVMAKIAGRKRTGGRGLEKDKPFNLAEAQANLAAAQKNPTVQERLARVAKEVDDPEARLVYEAAVLDEEGFYAARDLKIQQLQAAK